MGEWADFRRVMTSDTWESSAIPVTIKQWNFLLKSMAKGDVRYYLNGIYLDFSTGALVATDGHRLHYVPDLELLHLHSCAGNDHGIIIPDFVAKWIVKGAKKTDSIKLVRFESTEAIYKYALICGEKVICFKPIDGRFPDWQRVVGPHSAVENCMFRLTFAPDMLRESAKRLGLKRNKDLIRLCYDHSRQQAYIKYPSVMREGEFSTHEIDAYFKPESKFKTDRITAFDLWYVLDSIHGVTPSFTLFANDSTGCCFTLPDDLACNGVIMGIRALKNAS
jgi:hypothetical protein